MLSDRYRLDERLAAGGMGVVYRGVETKLDRPVAVKFLHEALAFVPDLKKRFGREVQAMGRLAHPNLVAILDSGVHGGVPFLVMEFLVGRPLSQEIEDRGALPPARALAIARQILAGVAHAHASGIVHRDLKPDNVLLLSDGADGGAGEPLKILDFGLAKMIGDSASGLTQLTNTGFALGTPGYMSPEQARGAAADERADLYAVGVMLYEMLAGRRPFVADSAMGVLRMHMEDPPPPLAQVSPAGAKVSPSLAAVVLRALAKDPARRWRSADAFARALEATPEGGGSEEQARELLDESGLGLAATVPGHLPSAKGKGEEEAPTSSRRRARARSGGLGTLVVIALLVGGGAFAWSRLGARERQRLRATLADTWKRARTKLGSATPTETPAPAPKVAAAKTPAPTPTPDPTPPTTTPPPPTEASPTTLAPTPAPPTVAPPSVAPDDDDDDDEPTPDAADTPGTRLEAEAVRTTAAPATAGPPTLADAQKLLAANRNDEAIQLLYRLRRATPKSPDVALLLGHAYFKKMWRSDGLREYASALQARPSLRKDARLRKNVVTALENPTSRRARALIRAHLGAAALPELRAAARTSPSPKAKRRAASLAAELTRRPARRR